jgi:hypothetical protein
MAIAAAGVFTSAANTGVVSVAHTSITVGNCVMVAFLTGATTLQVTAVSGGNATGWVRVAGPYAVHGNNLEMWNGVVNAVGAQTITATYTGAVTVYSELDCMEFTNGTGAGTTWARDGTQQAGFITSVASTTLTYPTLVPSGSGELYYGHGFGNTGGAITGTTAGYVSNIDAATDQTIYNVNVSASTSPTATLPSQTTGSQGVLMIATAPGGGGGVVPAPTIIRQAVQRAAVR